MTDLLCYCFCRVALLRRRREQWYVQSRRRQCEVRWRVAARASWRVTRTLRKPAGSHPLLGTVAGRCGWAFNVNFRQVELWLDEEDEPLSRCGCVLDLPSRPGCCLCIQLQTPHTLQEAHNCHEELQPRSSWLPSAQFLEVYSALLEQLPASSTALCTTPQCALTVARVGMGLEALDVMRARSWVSWVGLVANPVLC